MISDSLLGPQKWTGKSESKIDVVEREELHRRLEVLRDLAKEGKLHVNAEIAEGIFESLERIRLADDGIVDPETVDARARAMALGVSYMKDREDAKEEMPLQDIQDLYFQFLTHQFGELYDTMLERGATPHQVAVAYSHQDEAVAATAPSIPDFIEGIREFWSNVSFPTWVHAEDQRSLKAVYTGSLFPNQRWNIASVAGLYTDTIILPDPFLKIAPLLPHWDPKRQVYEVFRFGLQVLSYRELALADVDPPIVAFVPDRTGLEEDYREQISSMAREDTIRHASVIFGREFSTLDEVEAYAKQFDSPEALANALAAPERLLFQAGATEPLEEQIAEFLEGEGKILPLTTVGEVVVAVSVSRMNQITDVLMRSSQLRGTPIMDAETSWRYFDWKLEYDAERGGVPGHGALHVLRGLQDASMGEMRWLGNVPPDVLIEIRRVGALEELRQILGAGVNEIAGASPEEFEGSANQVVANIRAALNQYDANLDTLRQKKWKFATRDVGSWLAIGTIGVAAAVGISPVFGLAALAADQVFDVPKLKDLPGKFKELGQEEKELKRSAVGLLFQVRESAD